MRAGINRYRNHFQEDERKQKGAVGVVVNITPDTQTDTKWNRPNQKETEEKNPHNLLGGVYTRSEFIHTYYDEGTRILKREIIRETLFRVVARQQQRRRHIPMRLHNNYSMGSINTVSTLLHYCTHFFLYDSSSLMPPSPATLTLSLTCMDRYYLIAPKQTTPPFDPCPVNMWWWWWCWVPENFTLK